MGNFNKANINIIIIFSAISIVFLIASCTMTGQPVRKADPIPIDQAPSDQIPPDQIQTGQARKPIPPEVKTLTDLTEDDVNPKRSRDSIGDLNCDGWITFGDINPFVEAMMGEDAYYAEYPECVWENADINHDGSMNFGDINPFVDLLLSIGTECYDSDGEGIFNKGLIQNYQGHDCQYTDLDYSVNPGLNFDYCLDTDTVLEGVCLDNCARFVEYDCPPDHFCLDGACFFGSPEDTCDDGELNGDESDVDCGGSDCWPCDLGKICIEDSDCMSLNCTNGICVKPAFLSGYPNCIPLKLDNGVHEDHVNIVLLGAQYDYQTPFQVDGTTGYQKYLDDALKLLKEGFLEFDPYTGYDKINVFMVTDISGTEVWECGHHYIPVASDCTPDDCLMPDGLPGQWECESECRWVKCNPGIYPSPVTYRRNKCPYLEFDSDSRFYMIIVNDDYYGGEGGDTSATITRNEETVDLARHELLGHSIGNLADEYGSSGTASFQSHRLNCDIDENCARWSDLQSVFPEDEIGCYDGCNRYLTGISRGTDTSMMRELGHPFYSINERIICCELFYMIDTYPAFCTKFNNPQLPLSLEDWCDAQYEGRNSVLLTELYVVKYDEEFAVSEIRTRRNIFEDSEESISSPSFEVFDKDGDLLQINVAHAESRVPFVHPNLLPEGKKTEDYISHHHSDLENEFVVTVNADIEELGRLEITDSGKKITLTLA